MPLPAGNVTKIKLWIHELSFNLWLVFNSFLSDVNECTDKLHGCSEAAKCTNTKGSFSCRCENGYSGNGTYCIGNSSFHSFSNFYLELIAVGFCHQRFEI